ncbi:histidine phosphatase family protein [Sodalis sp. RH21]|uniref:histidine phosphatase family protein n=1 Tax=unclassified Sodalis (in: enterobacteria) TaxID=2636512 RepID=UPI0039B64EC4
MNLFLVRHGETQANCDGVYCGASDLPLTQRGRWQAHRVAWQLAEIRFDRILISRLKRSRETAQILRPQVEPECWAQWDEMDFGEWELRHHRDLRLDDAERYAAWCDDWQHVLPPGGEGFQSFSQRVVAATGRLRGQEQPGDILLVAHQGVLGIVLATLLGLPPTAMWHFPFQQDAFTQVSLDEGFCVLKHVNDSGRALVAGR